MPENLKFVKRDVFARMDTVRRKWDGLEGKCQWCGGVTNIVLHNNEHQVRKLYEYGEVWDDKPDRIAWDGKPFCCIGCRRAYNG